MESGLAYRGGLVPVTTAQPRATLRRMTGFVYITASQKRGTIYIGVSNSLARRIPEHREGSGSGFTARYGVQRLVWYEEHFDIRDAIQREKSLKRWPRQWKVELVEKTNPEWNELFVGTGW